MNANLKKIVGAAVASLALAIVACGKSGGGNNGNNAGINCVQVGASCVAVPPGYISSGMWRGNLYNGQSGTAHMTIQLSPNAGYGGGLGGGWGAGYGYPSYGTTIGNGVTQTLAQITIRTQSGVLSGTGIAQGTATAFSVSFVTQTPYGQQQVNVNGQFLDGTQRAMNVQTSGAITVSGMITGTPNTQGIGGVPGYGYGGGTYGGGYGYGYPGQVGVPVDPWF